MAVPKKDILVYAHWQGLSAPRLMGTLTATPVRGKESFSFIYSHDWLTSGFSQTLDPDLQLYPGAYYPRNDKTNFGVFLDSCPDRWGRVLLQRRESILARQEERPPRRLLESDFLLGVFDGHRMGALRFKTEAAGAFLNDNKEMASPPWTSLGDLEEASLKFEADDTDDPEYLRWLNLLIAPGSSLGGARPKASVTDRHNRLWIAKFPSRNDEKDAGAWEMVLHELATKAGVVVATGKLLQFNSRYHTYLSKRFDRAAGGERLHFASAMTLLGHRDGEDAGEASYLELVEFISRYGARVDEDLRQLWRRLVFTLCVKNTDDHLRNHGFLLTPSGWVLSPAYDLNPNEYGSELCLNITEDNNSMDLDLALQIAPYCRLSDKEAAGILNEVKAAVRAWRQVASRFKISKGEQDRVAPAFALAG